MSTPRSLETLEDARLLRAYHVDGDRSARERLIERHLPFVRALAMRYAHRGALVDDLFQVGAIGLINAVDRFDVSRDVAFRTYAIPTIVGEFRRYLRDLVGTVRVPRGIYELRYAVGEATDELVAGLGRAPTIAEVAAHLDVDPEAVVEATAPVTTTTVATSDDADDEEPRVKLGGCDTHYERAELWACLEPAIRSLSWSERAVLRLRFADDLTQSEIGEVLGISQMHVARLIRRGLSRLGAALEPDLVEAV